MKKSILIVGIDISMNDFHACIMVKDGDDVTKIKGKHSFSNDLKGFILFLEWVSKRQKEAAEVRFIMEATGVYHESLCDYLHDSQRIVIVEVPSKIKNFAKSYNQKSKTDKIDSEMIARYGMERNPKPWKPMSENFKGLRDFVRELQSIKLCRSIAKNQLHAMNYAGSKNVAVVELKKKQITFYDENIAEIETNIKDLVNQESAFAARVKKLETIKGLGFITIIILLCETNGFESFSSSRQLVSYSGLDVVHHESGTIKKKTRISKKGNKRIRQALFMPALSATQHNEQIKNQYERILSHNPDIKRKGVIAGMRKLLILTYTLWKKNEEYDPNYQWKAA